LPGHPTTRWSRRRAGLCPARRRSSRYRYADSSMSETHPISALTEGGSVHVVGTVCTPSEHALIAPFARRECSFYDCLIEFDLERFRDELFSDRQAARHIWIKDRSGLARIDAGTTTPRVKGAHRVVVDGDDLQTEAILSVLRSRDIDYDKDELTGRLRCSELSICNGDRIEVVGVARYMPWENANPGFDAYRRSADMIATIVAPEVGGIVLEKVDAVRANARQ
jgi:hypothetical protein